MAKDSYWFRHDSTAGRGLRLRKIQHIYGHWGKGIYWDVIEILREQDKYMYQKDDSSLQLLSSLIGCLDVTKFINWYRDCIKFDLLQETDNCFYSKVLSENMKKWQTKKRNGSKPKSEIEANDKAKHKRSGGNKIREDKRIKDKIFVPPSIEDVVAYFKENQYEEWLAKKAFNHYAVADWKDTGGKQVNNWKQKMSTNWFKEEGKIKPQGNKFVY